MSRHEAGGGLGIGGGLGGLEGSGGGLGEAGGGLGGKRSQLGLGESGGGGGGDVWGGGAGERLPTGAQLSSSQPSLPPLQLHSHFSGVVALGV